MGWISRYNKTIPVLILIGIMLGAFSTPVHADIGTCQYPLFIQVSGVNANVLFIFDSSGSMNEAIYHEEYDPGTVYQGDFSSTGEYYVSSTGSYSPIDFNGVWPSSPVADLVTSDIGRSATYSGNYLNWVYYNATNEQIISIPQFTRIQVAKLAVALTINNTEGIRFGIMKFNGSDGGTVVADIGSSKSTILSRLYEIQGDSWTPLAESMVDAMEYFQRDDSAAPIQESCQKNFFIVVTDGYPTMDRDIPSDIGDYDNDGNDPGDCVSVGSPYGNDYDCSDYMDDVALYIYENDMRADLDETQNIHTYTVGFNIDAGILQDTADNGDGLYFSAHNPEELAISLSEVLADIVKRTSSGTSIAVASTENSAENRIFRAKFRPGVWQGYLEAFELPYNQGDRPLWEAGEELADKSADSRKIYTSTDGVSKISFDSGRRNDLLAHLNTADPDTALDIIEYVRGNEIDGYRDRDGWKLGDIIDSSPVIVGAPAHFYDFLDYREFRAQHAERNPVIYVGANDGMIHCFDYSDGSEEWAYIPKNQLGKLRGLMESSYCHYYYVNGTPRAVDAYVKGKWRTILIGCDREGGNGYFALDVTNPSPDQVLLLWDISLPIVSESWGTPEIARVRDGDRFVAFIGSGPDRSLGEAHLVALNLDDGSVLWSDHLSTISGINKATDPAKIDIDFDGYDDLLYVGDFAGSLWRIDLRTDPWSKTLLFDANRPIQATPVLTLDENNNVLIYFGTGKYIEPADINDMNQQTFYSIIDNHSGNTVSSSSLVDQTYSVNPVGTNDRGWYVHLIQSSGERMIEPGFLAAGTVYFTSFKPLAEPCRAGGMSWLYNVDYEDGSSSDNDDGTENDTTAERVDDLGDGIYAEPVLDLANEDIIVQNSNSEILIQDAKGNLRRIIISSWHELFQ